MLFSRCNMSELITKFMKYSQFTFMVFKLIQFVLFKNLNDKHFQKSRFRFRTRFYRMVHVVSFVILQSHKAFHLSAGIWWLGTQAPCSPWPLTIEFQGFSPSQRVIAGILVNSLLKQRQQLPSKSNFFLSLYWVSSLMVLYLSPELVVTGQNPAVDIQKICLE